MRSTRSTSAVAVANHAVAARVVTEALGESAAELGLLGGRPSAPLAASASASDAFAEWRSGAAEDVMQHRYPLYGDLNLQGSVVRGPEATRRSGLAAQPWAVHESTDVAVR